VRAANESKRYAKNNWTPYKQAYQHFGALDRSNPNLDSVLNKVLPFDPQAASDRLTAQQGLNQALLRVKQGKDQLSEDYTKGVRELETEQPDRYRALLSNFASRGMAYSSGYGNALGKETADYTKARTDLDTANQRGLAAAGLDQSGAQSLFNSQLAAILANSTARLADNAGSLGMAGNTDLPMLLELARRRLAAQGAAP
jgi:hypothetical protein